MTWEGWPPEGLYARELLDVLYWGDDAREPGEGYYYTPLIVSEVAVSSLASFRHSHDVVRSHMQLFVENWVYWREKMGGSVEARKVHLPTMNLSTPDSFPPYVTVFVRHHRVRTR